MANVNTVSFGPAMMMPDIQSQQLELQRRQQLADMLRKDSMTPIEQQQVSGRMVPISPWQGLAKLGQAYFANKMQADDDQKQLNIGRQYSQRLVDALKGMAPAGVFDDKALPAAPGQLGSGMTDAVSPPAGAPTIPQAPQVDPATKQAWVRALSAMQINPELGTKLLENAATLTPEQKNNAAMGIDPQMMGRALMAKAVKEGRMEAQRGNTVLDPITMRPLYTAPDFKTGVQGGFDANGRPVMGRIAGSEVIPQMAGEVKRAEAAGNAGYNMITVNTPNGPVMMTAEQAARLSGGGAPAGGPIRFTASNGTKLNFDGVTPQQLFDMAQQSKDPAFRQAINEYVGSGQQRSPGISLQDEGTSEGNKAAAKQGIDTIFSQYGTLRTAPDLINTLETAKDLAPKSFAGTGAETKLEVAKFFNGTFGTNIAADKVKNTEELRSLLFRQVMDNLKKMDSQPSESQQKMLQQAMGTIGTDPSAIPKVIQITQDILAQRVQQHNDTVQQAMSRGVQFPFAPTIRLPTYSGAPAATAPAAPSGWSIKPIP